MLVFFFLRIELYGNKHCNSKSAVSFLNEEIKRTKGAMHENERGKRISAYFPFRNHEVYAVKLQRRCGGRDLKVGFHFFSLILF